MAEDQKASIESIMIGAFDRKLNGFESIAKRQGIRSALRVAAVDLAAAMEFIQNAAKHPDGMDVVRSVCVDLELMSLEALEREPTCSG